MTHLFIRIWKSLSKKDESKRSVLNEQAQEAQQGTRLGSFKTLVLEKVVNSWWIQEMRGIEREMRGIGR